MVAMKLPILNCCKPYISRFSFLPRLAVWRNGETKILQLKRFFSSPSVIGISRSPQQLTTLKSQKRRGTIRICYVPRVGRFYRNQNEKPTITLFTKDDCSLCNVAKEELERYKNMCYLKLVHIDQEKNKGWFEKYQYDVPVIHLNGKFLMKHKVFAAALDEALKIAISSSNDKRIGVHDDQEPSSQTVGSKDSLALLNYYSGSFIDRCAHIRKRRDLLEAKMTKETSRYVIFKSLQPLLTTKKGKIKEVCTLSYEDVSSILDSKDIFDHTVYLGTEENGIDWFALSLSTQIEESMVLDLCEGDVEFTNAFMGMMRLSDMQSSIAAQARGILAWHRSHQYCPECGSKSIMVEGGYRRQCTNNDCRTAQVTSHHACYPRVDPVTMALVVSPDHSKILLGRKPAFPPGFFTCLAGFVEPGESFETAVKREIREECGLQVHDIRYLISQCWPFPSSIMFGCIATAGDMNVHLDDDELEEVSWFNQEEAAKLISNQALKQFMAGEKVKIAPGKHALAHHLIKRWINGNY